MVNYPHNDLFNRGDTERQLQIAFSEGVITNKEMHQGSFELTESLCSQETLRFGCCESSVLKFKVHNVVTPLSGKVLTVSEILNGNTAEPFFYGKYKVYSDKPTADRKYRDIVAYDAMYDILNADVSNWYNSVSFPCTIGYFRKKFLAHFKIEEVETKLVNDDIYIEKTIDVTELSGKQVINAICEINGCFGHINRQGKFVFITLTEHKKGLFPSETLYPSDSLFPTESNAKELFYSARYSACKYEDFETNLITGLQIRQEEDDIGAIVGMPTNAYVIQDNFLVYGKTHDELSNIGNKLFNAVKNIYYRPIDYVKTNGKPYLEVGDNITIGSSEVIIETYILQRTIKGLKGQKDEFSAKGTEHYPKEINGLNSQIIQIKGKYNKLYRTVDETRSELTNLSNNTSTQFQQTSEKISAEAKRAEEAEASLTVRADKIALSVSDLERDFDSEINLLNDEISIRVKSEDLISEINVSNKAIELNGNRLIVDSTNFKLDSSGNCSMTGYIDATGGYVGAIEITSFGLVLAGDDYSGVLTNSLLSIKEISCTNFQASNITCTKINGDEPITSGNIDYYLPDIVITRHAESSNGGYYYSTNSTEASNYDKSIPSMQWVMNYVDEILNS